MFLSHCLIILLIAFFLFALLLLIGVCFLLGIVAGRAAEMHSRPISAVTILEYCSIYIGYRSCRRLAVSRPILHSSCSLRAADVVFERCCLLATTVLFFFKQHCLNCYTKSLYGTLLKFFLANQHNYHLKYHIFS